MYNSKNSLHEQIKSSMKQLINAINVWLNHGQINQLWTPYKRLRIQSRRMHDGARITNSFELKYLSSRSCKSPSWHKVWLQATHSHKFYSLSQKQSRTNAVNETDYTPTSTYFIPSISNIPYNLQFKSIWKKEMLDMRYRN